MSNDKAPREWKDYDEFAAGIDTNRLPHSIAFVGRTLNRTGFAGDLQPD